MSPGMTGQNRTPSQLPLWEGVLFLLSQDMRWTEITYFIYIIPHKIHFVNTFSEKISPNIDNVCKA